MAERTERGEASLRGDDCAASRGGGGAVCTEVGLLRVLWTRGVVERCVVGGAGVRSMETLEAVAR